MDDYKEIQDFWANKKNGVYTNKKELKAAIREYYTDDFIDKAIKWIRSVEEINEMIIMHVETIVPNLQDWEPMSFDYFCKHINQIMEDWIEKHDDIKEENIAECSEQLINQYIKYQINIVHKKRYSLSNLMKAIKSVKIGKYSDLKEETETKLLNRGEE